ncbi:hypothetical protein HELRODRAFT_76996, partial [Helobdella robusta]|uniref:RCC1-like domain-containing protein n=1 Tax=Helobdella robusta TaxID=6412 RepID=T1G2S2_HELRO
SGTSFSMGMGEVGQLGLGPDIMEANRVSKINLKDPIIQVCSGGMHSLCLTAKGEIYSFGCNDECSLGRKTEEEENCFTADKVLGIEGCVVQIAAGDSHSVALTNKGHVYIWGTFRDNSGVIGMNKDDENDVKHQILEVKIEKPSLILSDQTIVKIACGCSHLLCLSNKGDIFSLGASDCGQLGRVAEYFAQRGGRRGLSKILTPGKVSFRKKMKCVDIWAGAYISFARTTDGAIWAWGLNNYFQLGFPDMRDRFTPEMSPSFDSSIEWKQIACAEHHIIAMDAAGKSYSMGRKEYGRLGLGEVKEDVKELTLIDTLADKKVLSISAGASVSYAVDDQGVLYGWGMGSTFQLGNGNDEEDVYAPKPIKGKQLEKMSCIMASAGGQHTLLLASSK